MWFVALGCLLVVLKLADLTFVAGWSWLLVLSPFVLAVVWWFIADATGITKQREADREVERVRSRRERHLEAMGLNFKRGRPTGKPRVPSDDK